jgi:hypothetical protein
MWADWWPWWPVKRWLPSSAARTKSCGLRQQITASSNLRRPWIRKERAAISPAFEMPALPPTKRVNGEIRQLQRVRRSLGTSAEQHRFVPWYAMQRLQSPKPPLTAVPKWKLFGVLTLVQWLCASSGFGGWTASRMGSRGPVCSSSPLRTCENERVVSLTSTVSTSTFVYNRLKSHDGRGAFISRTRGLVAVSGGAGVSLL